MFCNIKISLFLYFLVAGPLPVNAESQKAQDVSLRTIGSGAPKKWGDLMKKKTLSIIFQEGCGPCRRQIEDLKCLDKDTSVILLGAASSESDLKREYQRMGRPYPAYFAPDSFLDLLKLEEFVTPQILVHDQNGKTHPLFVGQKPCSFLKSRLAGDKPS